MNKNKNKTELEKLLENNNKGIYLDVGCGESKQLGFVGIDYRKLPGVDIVQDLQKFPWPLPDECASFALSTHVVEHIEPNGGIFMQFMDEVWRILKPDSEFFITGPYAGSYGYWQDPTHCNGCNEMTWEYFDPLGTMSGGHLYRIYKPKPWKIKINTFQVNGNFEVVLIKRRMDKSYE